MAAKTSAHVIALIDSLEAKIKKGDVAPDYVEGLQRQLNDGTVLSSDARYHQYAFELQALIYKAEGEQDSFTKCMGAAVEQAGSVQRLHSHLLKTYARKDMSISPDKATRKTKWSNAGDPTLLTDSEQAFLRRHGLEAVPDVDFLTRSIPSFAMMFLLSGGFYGTYWLYKNWQAVRDASEVGFSPLWRTLLSIIYIWPLFKMMVVLAKSRGFNVGYSGGALAAGYILTAFVSVIYGLSIKGSRIQDLLIQVTATCLYLLFTVMAQQAAVLVVSKQSSNSEVRPINYVELLFVAVGLVFLLASVSDNKTTTLKHEGSLIQQVQSQSPKR